MMAGAKAHLKTLANIVLVSLNISPGGAIYDINSKYTVRNKDILQIFN